MANRRSTVEKVLTAACLWAIVVGLLEWVVGFDGGWALIWMIAAAGAGAGLSLRLHWRDL